MKHYKVNRNLDISHRSVEKNKSEVSKSDIYLVAKYFNIGYYLITPVLLGVFFGFIVDKYLESGTTFTIIFIFLGSISSFYNLLKIVKEFS